VQALFSSNQADIQPQASPVEDRRVEVSIESGADGERVVLRYSTWTDGLGWCNQKTIHLDGEHLDDLHRALTVARHRLNRKRAEAGQPIESAKVIQLPTLA
jgi:hypothetical protein